MAKVMFVVSFPNLHSDNGQDTETNLDKETDKDNSLTCNKEASVTPEEKDKLSKEDVECSDEFENRNSNKQNVENSSIEEPDTANSIKSEAVSQKKHSKDTDSSDSPTPDVIAEKESSDNLDNISQKSVDKNDSEREKEKPEFVRFISQGENLLETVKQTLETLLVSGVQWNLTEDNMHIGTFISDYGAQCELIIKRLSMLKIGITKNSSISVFPASICVAEESQKDVEILLEREDKLQDKVSEFRKSIKSRLVVDQVVTSVQGDAVFTFDFLMLVILASFVAIMGLLEASSVVLVASMLISPLMGPILAAVFGTVINRSDLVFVGVSSELKGLGICILVGFILGFIPACLEAGSTGWRSSLEWPTIEMSSRGALRSLPVGILIAIPSGAGVALSILGGKIGSLVGVAISASLLPPAVNAGLLWANAIVVSILPPAEEHTSNSRTSNVTLNTTASSLYLDNTQSGCRPLLNNDYVPLHSCNIALESFILGFISLSLTILNIACIIFMGILVLKLKEVAPLFHRSERESEKDFFCKDLRIARESYATTKGESAAAMKQQWLIEYKDFKSKKGKYDDGDDDDDDSDDEQEVDNIIESVQDSPAVTEIIKKMRVMPQRWSRIASSISKSTSSSSSNSSNYFSFNNSKMQGCEHTELHVSSPRNEMSALPTSPQTATSVKAVGYTVHRFVHPRSLMASSTSSWKKGKFLMKLTVPQESRFLIAKIEEAPEEKRKQSMISTVQEEETEPVIKEKETDNLLATETEVKA